MVSDETSDGLRRAICERPDDDGLRLAFSDWLEENQQLNRAEFIRYQCGVRKEPYVLEAYEFWEWFGSYTDTLGRAFPGSPSAHLTPVTTDSDIPGKSVITANSKAILGVEVKISYGTLKSDKKFPPWIVRIVRGFIDAMLLPEIIFTDYAARLFSEQPITKIGLVSPSPYWSRFTAELSDFLVSRGRHLAGLSPLTRTK